MTTRKTPAAVVRTAAGDLKSWLSRSGVPMVMAVLVGWLASKGIHLNAAVQSLVTSAIGAGAGFGYALVVHLLERRWPGLSVLLGSVKQPTYVPSKAPDGPTAG